MFGGKTWVLDGGLASTLEENGISVDGDPLWSAKILHTNPDAIKKVHSEFLDAGAQILTTASYQASIEGYKKHLNITKEAAINLITLSVTLANESIKEHRAKNGHEDTELLVIGSVGPYGACQADGSEYSGKYVDNISTEELINWHRPRIDALITGGVDLLAIETIPSLKEAVAVLELLKEYPNVKAWVSFSCKDGEHTNYGDKFSVAVKKCYDTNRGQVIALGVNCTAPQYITSLLEKAITTLPNPSILPRVVYPNSAEQWIPGKGWEGKKSQYVDNIIEWQNTGAYIIGGCCRVSPNNIKTIAREVSTNSRSSFTHH